MTYPDHHTGILLHITSLPGPNPVTGTLGKDARRFVDTLAAHHCRLWQMLPVGPVFAHRSPYESPSSVAGNPDLLDLQPCVASGWLSETELQAAFSGKMSLQKIRQQASHFFWKSLQGNPDIAQRMRSFMEKNEHWLRDFALFMALKMHFKEQPWWLWPDSFKDRETTALNEYAVSKKALLEQVYFEQFMFAEQWHELKNYAENKGIMLVGDIPIYVAHDSADVWASKELFSIDDTGLCIEVAGVPPDYFSEDGQRWGSPLYRWAMHEEQGFKWWRQRIAVQAGRFHSLRIDHFRGLESYWAIPAEQPDGKTGQWRPAPGDALLECLTRTFAETQFIAEDLGIITDEVKALRERYALPGMKILQFAFDGMPDNPYLPDNIEENYIVYTGTHDNDTVVGWIHGSDDETLDRAMQVLQCSRVELPWAMIRAAVHANGRWSIIPLQDILGLDQTARMNIPGTTEGNWQWRFDALDYDHQGWQTLQQYIEMKETINE